MVGRYLYTDIHNIFFTKFSIILHEWLSKIEKQKKLFQGGELIEWLLELMQRLKITSNPISMAIYFWVDRILGGYITKIIAVDTINSYSETKRYFLQGPRGRYLKSLKLWIKMMVCEKGIMRMESDK